MEAVIYAAEEPVTLAQLAALFTEEALAWKASKLDAITPESTESPLGDAPDAIELAEFGQEFGNDHSNLLLTPQETPDASENPAPAGQEAAPETPAAETSGSPAIQESPEDVAAEAKRAERRREREIRDILREALDELIAEYADDNRGIEIREIAGGFRMGTKPEMHDSVRAFVKSLKPPLKLSLPALETLAVIAYKQPVTAPEVSEIRGVDSAGVLGSLMSRKLIATAGRKQVIGRPMLYKTTKEFLVRFGLKDVSELPSMEEFEKMAAMELSEEVTDGETSETAAPVEHSGDLFVEKDEAGIKDEAGEGKTSVPAETSEEAAPSDETPAEPAQSEAGKEPETAETAAPEAPAAEEAVEESAEAALAGIEAEPSETETITEEIQNTGKVEVEA